MSAMHATTIEITSPANSATYTEGDTLKIKAHLNNTGSITTAVEFYVNNVLIGKDFTAPYEYNWICVEGTHSLMVKEIVGSCQDATSIPVQITVKKNKNPQITLTAPNNGGTYADALPISLQATASDSDGTISHVDFYINSIFAGSVAGIPYQLNWKSIPGTFSIIAKAIDNKGASTNSTPVTITVTPTTDSPPTVLITSPANGSSVTLGTPITIKATATDADGVVQYVEFFANNSSLGIDSVAPFELNWPGTPGHIAIKAKATDNQCISTMSTPVNITVIDPNAPPYLIETISASCITPSFCLPIIAVNQVKDVNGYDITLKYDKTKVYPTGQITVSNDLINAAYTSYSVNNIDSLGVINISVFLNSNAPTQTSFSGTGQLLCIGFEKKAAFAGNDSALFNATFLQESYITGVLQKQVTPGKYVNKKNMDYPGVLEFWKDSAPIKYDAANPSHYLITNVYGVDNSCNNKSITVIQPDTTGKIQYNILNGPALQIERDIQPNTYLQDLINGMDANLAYAVVLNDVSFTPSVYQLIALDVNMDGVISAGDISQINQRSIGTLPEFRQKWNYNATGQLSKDWLFIDSTLLANPGFKISTTYPSNDGIGYSKSKVPSVPFCLQVPTTLDTSCNTYPTGKFTGILLGDVDGNYESIQADGTRKRINFNDGVITLDLSNATIGKGYIDVPLLFSSSEKIVALDLAMKINPNTLNFSKVVHPANYLNDAMAYCNDDHLLRFTSNTSKQYEANKTISTLRFYTNNEKIKAADFTELKGYLNGAPVRFKIKEAVLTEIKEANSETDIQIYPNPANELLNVIVTKKSVIQLLDIQGKEVLFEMKAKENEKTEIPTSNFKSGTYLLKIMNEHSVKIQQVVIDRR